MATSISGVSSAASADVRIGPSNFTYDQLREGVNSVVPGPNGLLRSDQPLLTPQQQLAEAPPLSNKETLDRALANGGSPELEGMRNYVRFMGGDEAGEAFDGLVLQKLRNPDQALPTGDELAAAIAASFGAPIFTAPSEAPQIPVAFDPAQVAVPPGMVICYAPPRYDDPQAAPVPVGVDATQTIGNIPPDAMTQMTEMMPGMDGMSPQQIGQLMDAMPLPESVQQMREFMRQTGGEQAAQAFDSRLAQEISQAARAAAQPAPQAFPPPVHTGLTMEQIWDIAAGGDGSGNAPVY